MIGCKIAEAGSKIAEAGSRIAEVERRTARVEYMTTGAERRTTEAECMIAETEYKIAQAVSKIAQAVQSRIVEADYMMERVPTFAETHSLVAQGHRSAVEYLEQHTMAQERVLEESQVHSLTMQQGKQTSQVQVQVSKP